MAYLYKYFTFIILLPFFISLFLKMRDQLQLIQDIDVGVDEDPIVVPPTICAHALRSNLHF